MTEETRQTPADPPDASDVVEGPVGSASLKDPATSGPMGADLSELPTVEDVSGGTESSSDAETPDQREPSAHERQDSDHTGVDWELTTRDRD